MRGGADARLKHDPETGKSLHTLVPVYREMILQITRDYPGLPDPRTMRLHEIRFFYEGLRRELREATKSSKK